MSQNPLSQEADMGQSKYLMSAHNWVLALAIVVLGLAGITSWKIIGLRDAVKASADAYQKLNSDVTSLQQQITVFQQELSTIHQNIETLKASTRDTPRTSANPPSAPAATTGVNPGGSESGLRRRR